MAEMEKRRRRASAEVGIGETAEVEQQETEIDLLELFYNLLENWKLLAAAVIAGALIMALKNIGIEVDETFSAELAANIRNFLSVNKGAD